MRAFMSDINGGPVWLDVDHAPAEDHFGMPAEAFAAELALREARMILAENEPGRKGNSKTWWGSVTHRYIDGFGPYPTRRDPYFAALSETLRTFVED